MLGKEFQNGGIGDHFRCQKPVELLHGPHRHENKQRTLDQAQNTAAHAVKLGDDGQFQLVYQLA